MPEANKNKAYTILVMDDEDYICKILEKMLVKFGYQVVLTSDGTQAIDRYTSLKTAGTPVDMAILDLSIPGGMGGEKAARRILEFDPDARIVISTGNPNDSIFTEYERLGIKNVISKPFRLNYLAEIVEQTLHPA
jgi:two-component system cell cycle sensor histidine kinase/response regulator CckA